MKAEIKGPLTILELRAENIKRISVVRIRPDGALVQVTGNNGQGKSSVLDSIEMALDWAHSVKPARPIRKGSREGRIELDLGEIKATRVFRESGSTELRLEAKDGSNIRSPQTLLDTLIGRLSFNPLAFMQGDDKTKFEALRSFVPGVDFDEIEAQNESDYAKRTDENRRAKELLAQAAGLMVSADPQPERINLTKVVADLERAEETNKQIAARRARREAAARDLNNGRKIIRDIESQIARLQEQLVSYQQSVEHLETSLANAEPLPEEIDTASLREQITKAHLVNAIADKAERRSQLLEQAGQHEQTAKALTEAMDARKEAVRAAIAAAEMPVPGLSLADGKVLLDGIELRDCSTAEQLKLSIAVAMAKNPTSRVILIRDGGNDLDEGSMKLLAAMAEEKGYQVWIERIHAEGGPPAVIMEDGHVKQ